MLKVAIIGLRHPHILSFASELKAVPAAQLVAVAEPEQELQGLLSGVPFYDDYRQMLERERPDVVGVATVNRDKGAVIAECLERGLHVIADKPLVTSFADLERVEQAWQHSGRRLLAMFTLRYEPAFLALAELVQGGGLGEPVALFATGPHKLNLPTRKPWMLRDELCGGIIVDLGCHYVDLARWLTQEECLALAAVHGAKRFVQLPGFTDFAQVQLRLSKGAVATIQVDWLTPDAAPYHGDMRLFFTGTRGTAELRLWPWPQVLVATIEREPYTLSLPLRGKSLGQDFLEAILEDRPTALSTEDCLEATRLTLLAREAAESGSIVPAR
jgi:predicted dehydrogenase